jgi:hypothetical protein
MIPFIISAIIALFGFTKAPRIFTRLGFVVLLFEFVILVVFPIEVETGT